MTLKDFANKLFTAAGSFAGSMLVEEYHNDPSIEELRKGRCRGTINKNPCMFYKESTDQCKVCKCFVEVKSKALTNIEPKTGDVVITHCPMGWWDDEKIAELYRVQ
jgi:hypothetical protein